MAVFQKTFTVIRCERCGYEWIPKDPKQLPTVCSNRACKSPAWNKPRPKRQKGGTLMKSTTRTLLLPALLVLAAPRAHAQPLCVGDCDGDRRVAVNELVTAVRVLLGEAQLSACPASQCERCVERHTGAGWVIGCDFGPQVSCLVVAVNNSLDGCETPAAPARGSGASNRVLAATHRARAGPRRAASSCSGKPSTAPSTSARHRSANARQSKCGVRP
jgi:hypothetical protein